ncbi:DUF1700 domain-containing protein [Undibacterium sp. TJN25]|uniref:DUF1700 domain-containing protein n=1 Tax=Undibacterium sp. TJN25 TaxID=3413056 RepID=UPI003BF33A48
MDKTEYMNALRQALEGLPAEVIEETMWGYERKFIDAMVAGRSEEEIAASLPRPSLVAAQKKTSVRYEEVKRDFSLGNVASLFISLIGLLVFNLFMLIPATVYFCLLFATYVCALAFYGVGIGITAASLSGVPQFNFDIPVHGRVVVAGSDVQMRRHQHAGNVRVDISPAGIIVDDDSDADDIVDDADNSRSTTVTIVSTPAASKTAVVAAPAASAPAAPAAASIGGSAVAPAIASAGSAADESKVRVNVGNHVKHHHIWEGLGLLFGGILLFLFALFMTRYTFIGFKNYLQWNISLLKLPAAARASAA